jgi:hypothetical protein
MQAAERPERIPLSRERTRVHSVSLPDILVASGLPWPARNAVLTATSMTIRIPLVPTATVKALLD